MFAYNEDQLSQIRALVTNGSFPAAYRLAASFASGGEGVSQASILWMQGAANINENVGSEAAFVRQYTAAQFEVRFGVALDLNVIQDVSNKIAGTVLEEILRTGTVPSISTIAQDDALPAARDIFRGDPGGWAGNPLFLFLGHSAAFTNNILEVPGDTYDALAMIKYLGATGSWASNLANAFGATMGTGSIATISAGVSQTDTFLRAAYGGIGTSFQVLSSQVILGRVDIGSTLNGLSGGEFMRGGRFDDTLKSSAGDDVMDGGGGRDIADYSNASGPLNVTVKFEHSTANYTAGVTGSAGIDALFGIEEIIGSNSDDMFLLRSFPTLTGQLTLDGAGGTDQLSAFYLPSVTINIANGSLTSGGNTIAIRNFEKFEGTNGGDTFVLIGNEERVDGRAGADTVDYSNAAHGVNFQGQAARLKGIENIIATRFDDEIDADAVLNATGSGSETVGGLDNEIYGLAGNDRLFGGAGADKIFGGGDNDELLDGGAGVDEIYGGEGDDKLYGGTGDDKLFGSIGKDRLTGGAGSDKFYVGSGDIVMDSDSGDTLLVVDGDGTVGDGAPEDETYYTQLTQPGMTRVFREYSDLNANYLEGYNHFYLGQGGDFENGDFRFFINTGRSLVILSESEASSDYVVAKDYQTGDFGLDIFDPAKFAATAKAHYEANKYGYQKERFILTPYLESLKTALALEKQAYEANREGRSDLLQVLLETPAEIAGTQETDFLQGTAGGDEIVGGGEMDLLLGGAGSDIYRYAAGDGDDYIMDYDGNADDIDVLTFDDLNIGDVELSGSGGADLYVNVLGAQPSTITIVNQFAEAGLEGIEEIHFADGAVLNRAQILEALQTVRGTAGDDELYFKPQQINGEWQPTTFVGGHGSDHVHGGYYGDTYVYAKGDGNDTIQDSADGIGTLRLVDLNPHDIIVSRLSDNSIEITVGDTGETITVNPFSNQTIGFDRIVFANEDSWDRDDILAATHAPRGTTLTGDAVAENATNGTVVGTVAGVDPDADAVLTYTLTNDADGRFAIDATTGQITVANAALLDYESAASHSVAVRVTDQGGLSFDKAFTISIANVSGTLTGGSADDALVGSPEEDMISGLGGNDNLEGGLGPDVLDGGSGTDTASYAGAPAGVTASLGQSSGNTGEAAGDTYTSVENLTGSAFADTLTGDGNANTIDGGGSNDVITGNGGNDFLFGSAGNDMFVFQAGFGDDTIGDFEAGAAVGDVIEIDSSLFADFATVQAHAQQIGTDTVIAYDANNTITLSGVNLASLNSNDFQFA